MYISPHPTPPGPTAAPSQYGAGTLSEPPKHTQTLVKATTNHPTTTFGGRFAPPNVVVLICCRF